jgi:hypothetical protein
MVPASAAIRTVWGRAAGNKDTAARVAVSEGSYQRHQQSRGQMTQQHCEANSRDAALVVGVYGEQDRERPKAQISRGRAGQQPAQAVALKGRS